MNQQIHSVPPKDAAAALAPDRENRRGPVRIFTFWNSSLHLPPGGQVRIHRSFFQPTGHQSPRSGDGTPHLLLYYLPVGYAEKRPWRQVTSGEDWKMPTLGRGMYHLPPSCTQSGRRRHSVLFTPAPLPASCRGQRGAAVRSVLYFAFLNVRPLAHPPGYLNPRNHPCTRFPKTRLRNWPPTRLP